MDLSFNVMTSSEAQKLTSEVPPRDCNLLKSLALWNEVPRGKKSQLCVKDSTRLADWLELASVESDSSSYRQSP